MNIVNRKLIVFLFFFLGKTTHRNSAVNDSQRNPRNSTPRMLHYDKSYRPHEGNDYMTFFLFCKFDFFLFLWKKIDIIPSQVLFCFFNNKTTHRNSAVNDSQRNPRNSTPRMLHYDKSYRPRERIFRKTARRTNVRNFNGRVGNDYMTFFLFCKFDFFLFLWKKIDIIPSQVLFCFFNNSIFLCFLQSFITEFLCSLSLSFNDARNQFNLEMLGSRSSWKY
jgi:hypothetical protein